jgi:hypothetical protein
MGLPMDWKYLVDKVTQSVLLSDFFIMSTDLMVAALRRGQTGSEILTILDALTGGNDDAPVETVTAQPTMEIVEF